MAHATEPPLPPTEFHLLNLPTTEVDPGNLVRIYPWGRRPLSFHVAKTEHDAYRFDAPQGEFGALYAGFDLETCFADALAHEAARGSWQSSRPDS